MARLTIGGTLTIENGTYTGSVDASGASIKNRPDSVLKIQDGTFNGAVTAVYNAGKTYIYDGTFDCRSCSSCNSSSWGYTIQSHQDSEESAKPNCISIMVLLLVYKGFFHIGRLFWKCGTASLKPWWHAISTPMVVLRSMHCTSGESGEVECNVYGGEFTL